MQIDIPEEEFQHFVGTLHKGQLIPETPANPDDNTPTNDNDDDDHDNGTHDGNMNVEEQDPDKALPKGMGDIS
ncbi:hypothetical protein PG988_010789 [Apiospora saccharicola]